MSRESVNTQQLIAQLKRMRSEGGSGNFLIVSCGDAYVQFAAGRGERQIYCEAVSNAYLPRYGQLSWNQMAQLQQHGFDAPGDGTENFSRNFTVADEDALAEIAELTVRILAEVYHCEAALTFELNLE